MKNYIKEQVYHRHDNMNQTTDILQYALYCSMVHNFELNNKPKQVLNVSVELLNKADKAGLIYWDDIEGPMFGNVPVEVRL